MKIKLAIFKLLIILAVASIISYFSPKIISGTTTFKSTITQDSLYPKMGTPKPHEWLSITKELGQTYKEYINSNPNKKTAHRNKLYIRPIGDFTDTEIDVLHLTSEYLSKFYNIPVEILAPISINTIPKTSQRTHQNISQASGKYILNDVLAKDIPDDAIAYMGFTKIDLYNDPKNNFVFGLGNLKKRVGVYSLARYGNPDKNEASYKKFVLRTLKVASHELGHIFSVKHCIEYKCIMNGSNSITESDLKPVYLCPIDLKKIRWNRDFENINRFKTLEDFWSQNGFNKNADFYKKSISFFE